MKERIKNVTGLKSSEDYRVNRLRMEGQESETGV